MRVRARRLLVVVGAILFLFPLWSSPTTGQSAPTPAAVSAFEALQAAESAGANITSLLNEYNSLLQRSASDSSYATLGQLAQSTQQNAIALRSFGRTLTLVLVPVIALVLALGVEGLLQLRRKIERERMLEMEIR